MTHFDIQGAKDAGFTDAEIANALGQDANFDVTGARQAGFDDANIIQTITTGSPFREVTPAAALTEGISRGAVDLLSTIGGAPVDVASFLQEQTLGRIDPRLGPGEQPFLGSESIRSGLQAGFEAIGTPIQQLEDIRPELRPLGIGGEVIGGAALPAAAPFAVARGAGGIFKPIVNLAQTAPRSFLAAEAASTAGAAGGGAVAELVDPGDPITRFLAEVGGGLFSPGAILARTGRKSFDSVKNLVSSFTGSGREQRAANIIQDIVSEAGENPDDIIRLLDKADIQGLKLTAGQKTASPALLALESKLAQKSSRFAGESEDLATNSLKTLRELTDNLQKSGDPAALRTAAKLRQRYFDQLLSSRVEDAGQDALEARAAIGGETPADLANISTKARKTLRTALTEARAAESSLWDKIPNETPLSPENTIRAFDDVKATLLPEESIDPISEGFIRRMRGLESKNKVSSAGELIRFRKRMLALGRDAAANNKFDSASQFNSLAEGVLDDLVNIPGDSAIAARQFSAQLHEKFTNTFAGNALARGSRGERIPAEIMLERAFGSGGTQAELRFRQIQEAGDFPGQVFGQPILDQQERFLRVAAQNTVDNTGRVNPNQLQNFLNKNQAMLERFPDLKRNLSDAVTAEQTFKGVEASTKTSTKAIQQRTAFANLMKTDDPVVAVGNVLTGQNTRAQYSQLAKLAKRSGKGSVEGLKSATLKNVFDKATDSSGQFSFRRLDQILKKGLSREDQGVLSLMRQNGVIDKGTTDRLTALTKRAIQIEDALGNSKKLDKLIEDPDALFDLVTRIAGAKLGTAGIAGGAGSGLIAAQAGSKFARNFAEKIPSTKLNEVFELAAKDGKFMSMLLKKTKTIKARVDIERQINAFLISAGLQLEEE